jgi:hypothetical protein
MWKIACGHHYTKKEASRKEASRKAAEKAANHHDVFRIGDAKPQKETLHLSQPNNQKPRF